MFSRLILINYPGLGVGDVRNSSSSNHSMEQLLRYVYEQDLNLDLSGLESIGFDAFVKYQGSAARKSSITARLAAKNPYGNDDFSAFIELGGGDSERIPVFAQLADSNTNNDDDVFIIAIAADESIFPSHEFLEVQSDIEAADLVLEVLSAPLVRNELVIANFMDYRQAALESNGTYAAACLMQLSNLVKQIQPLLGSDDALMLVSTTAIDPTSETREFRNELTPMMFHRPAGQIHDLGLRLLADLGPSIAEFFNKDRTNLVGASMGKWFALKHPAELNPRDQAESPLQS